MNHCRRNLPLYIGEISEQHGYLEHPLPRRPLYHLPNRHHLLPTIAEIHLQVRGCLPKFRTADNEYINLVASLVQYRCARVCTETCNVNTDTTTYNMEMCSSTQNGVIPTYTMDAAFLAKSILKSMQQEPMGHTSLLTLMTTCLPVAASVASQSVVKRPSGSPSAIPNSPDKPNLSISLYLHQQVTTVDDNR